MTTTQKVTVEYNGGTRWTVYAVEAAWCWEKGESLFSVNAETLEDALAIAIREAELEETS